MRYADHISELVGGTPLIRLTSATEGIACTVLAKVEYLNPGGSVKDRIALRMVEAAEASGELRPGGTIVEPTSGNTGVGLALVAQRKGYDCVFVCPDKVGADKINVLESVSGVPVSTSFTAEVSEIIVHQPGTFSEYVWSSSPDGSSIMDYMVPFDNVTPQLPLVSDLITV